MSDDEHPNERLVTPSEDGEGFDRSLVSRRSMLGGSALLAGLLAYTSDPTDPQLPGRASGSAAGIARASDNPDEPLIILGPESDPVGYLFQDTAGGIIVQDATSGNHFWYNESQDRWETDAPLDIPSLVDESILSFFDGSELTADVNNTLITTEQVDINDFAAVLEKTTVQSISANTDTTLDWDNQDVDTDIFTYDTTNDDIDVLVAGDYRVEGHLELNSLTDQTDVFFKVLVNGSVVRSPRISSLGSVGRVPCGVLLKDLSANDTIRIDARMTDAGNVSGNSDRDYAMISKEA